ncbi:MAG: DUF935 family protein [Rhizobiales bacterium]|nr:DUF935 family protein [Hyphomicrobiales bacterium]
MTNITEQKDQPTSKKNLKTAIKQEVASAVKDITINIFNGLLEHQDETLAARGGQRSYKIYEEVERDTHIYAVLQKRKQAVIAREWVIKPLSDNANDKASAEFIDEQFKKLKLDEICRQLLDATLKGFSVAEIMWKRDGNNIVVDQIKSRNQERFVFDVDWQPRLLTLSHLLKGEELPKRKFMVHRFDAKDSNAYGLGLGSRLFWPALFKRKGIAYWLTHASKYASPTPVGELGPNVTSPEDQRKLLESLVNMTLSGAIVVPDGTKITALEGQKSGSDTYQDLCRFMDEQASTCVLGETLTTNVGKSGSRALGDVHDGVRCELADMDCDLLAATINETLLAWMCELNGIVAKPTFSWVSPEDEKAKIELNKSKAEFFGKMKENGYEPELPEQHFEVIFGNKWRKVEGAALPPFSDKKQKKPFSFSQDNIITPNDKADEIVNQLEQFNAASENIMIDHLKDLVDTTLKNGGDLVDVRDQLIDQFGQIDVEPMAEIMGQALILAELQGRHDVNEGE